MSEKKEFIDVPETHWAYSAIQEFVSKGIIKGYSDDTFKPDAPITRAEVAAILARLRG
ncbi:S-layer homology domain-containing protein [Massilibacteroides sp.]|uniref:S-layer homology domain-containing protein n=1 Tax=Massilibacteroides sp. TaxID=2034766 RepID=UPI00261A82E7|nr:S-layer homology domain-containing protein [Massilibacteroides sp.]MDD4516339.1 S-layer homology domain-containing protein [Massilibacteroides sp.]